MSRLCCTNNTQFVCGGRGPLQPTGSASAVLADDECEEIRVDKVLEIRRQLGEGTYSVADRLNVVVEKIIEDLG